MKHQHDVGLLNVHNRLQQAGHYSNTAMSCNGGKGVHGGMWSARMYSSRVDDLLGFHMQLLLPMIQQGLRNNFIAPHYSRGDVAG